MMPQFLNPALAWAGVAAVALPILIHLLTRRPKRPKEWAAMRFLLAVYRKHRTRSRIEQLLLLAVRCLLVLLIGLALAGPVFAALGGVLGMGSTGRTVVIILDNSLTSTVMGEDGVQRIEQLKTQAEAVIDSLSSSDQVALITASGPPEALISPPKLDLDAARRRIQEITASESAADIGESLRLAAKAVESANDPNRPTFLILLSDFSSGAARIDELLSDDLKSLGQRVTLLRSTSASSRSNTQIVSLTPDRRLVAAELQSPGQEPSVTWTIRLRRFGATPATSDTVRLELPASPPWIKTVTWVDGQKSATFTVPLQVRGSGAVVATASIESASDTLTADNTRRAVIQVRKKLALVILGRKQGVDARQTPQHFLRSAVGPEDGQIDWPIDYSEADAAAVSVETLRDMHFAFMLRPDLVTDQGWADLRSWVSAGGVVWVMPPMARSVGIWPQKMVDRFGLSWTFDKLEPVEHDPPLKLKSDRPAVVELERLAGEIQRKGILRSVEVYWRLPIKKASVDRSADRLLVGTDDEPLLLAADVDRGRLIFTPFAMEPTWTNLPARRAFPPLLGQLIRGSTDRLQSAEAFIVGNRPHLYGAWARAGRIVGPDGQSVRLAAEGLSVQPIEPMRLSGVYRSPNEVLALVANVSADAGDTEAHEPEALNGWLSACGQWRAFEPGTATAAVALKSEGDRADWSIRLLIAVAILALVEMFLARWISHANVRGRTENAVSLADARMGGA
jgi:hypothetical protein